MTDDSLQHAHGLRTLPTDEINYMRNAVKATVDAYDGTVTLYAWDEDDPILKAWRDGLPGHRARPKSEIPTELLEHLRYPEDLFKVQRYQFARYHVTDAERLLRGQRPVGGARGPDTTGKLQPPYRLFVAGPRRPASDDVLADLGLRAVQQEQPGGVRVRRLRRDRADDYGKIRVLRAAQTTQSAGPGADRQRVQLRPRRRQAAAAVHAGRRARRSTATC